MEYITLRRLADLVLIAAIAGIVVMAYNAGAAHQIAITAEALNAQTVSPV